MLALWRPPRITDYYFENPGFSKSCSLDGAFLEIIYMFLGSISNRFEVKSCNCEKPSRFSSFPFCPLDDAISFVELSFDIFKLSVYYTHLKDIYGVLKLSPLLYIPKIRNSQESHLQKYFIRKL